MKIAEKAISAVNRACAKLGYQPIESEIYSDVATVGELFSCILIDECVGLGMSLDEAKCIAEQFDIKRMLGEADEDWFNVE